MSAENSSRHWRIWFYPNEIKVLLKGSGTVFQQFLSDNRIFNPRAYEILIKDILRGFDLLSDLSLSLELVKLFETVNPRFIELGKYLSFPIEDVSSFEDYQRDLALEDY